MNKKAQFEAARKTIYWMLAGVVITIIILAFAITIAGYKNKLAYVPPELKAELISLRFTNTPECFAYYDQNAKKTSPGIIDLDKFNKAQMDKCYNTTTKEKGYKDYNFGLALQNQNLKIIPPDFFNKVDFTIYKEVLVKKGNHLLKDQLIIYVQEKI